MRLCIWQRAVSLNVKATPRYNHSAQPTGTGKQCQAYQIAVSSRQGVTRYYMYHRQCSWTGASQAAALCTVFAPEMDHYCPRAARGSQNPLPALQCPIQPDRYIRYTVLDPWAWIMRLAHYAPAPTFAYYLPWSREETMSDHFESKLCWCPCIFTLANQTDEA